MLLTKEKVLNFFSLLLSLAWLNALNGIQFMMFLRNEYVL